MRKTLCFVWIAVAFAILSSCREESLSADYNVIPLPREIVANGDAGHFTLNGKTVISYPAGNDSLKLHAEQLRDYLRLLTGHELKITDAPQEKNAVNLQIDSNIENPEGYELKVNPNQIVISGSTPAGVFYGIQTLRKSIPAYADGKYNVEFPTVSITDYPRFGYRGAHFDVSRHFFPADSVKKFIDLLALHNINRLHWHISDDQGWRVEIKKYPRLTEIGSKRPGTVIGHNTDEYDSIPVEGFFTQDQIKDIISYASDRHITIIPEIDLPGHMQSALAAYPELGCTGGPYEVWKRWGVSTEVLCGGNDSVYVFIRDVLDEISDLFPSEYIHIGGDECPKVRWEECEKCQLRIKELGLKGDIEGTPEEKLQSHIMKYVENFLATKGKKIIGWDEILEGGASQSATIMSWRGEDGGIAAARRGNDVIMTPNIYLYFDYYQTLDRDNEPIAIGGYVPLEKVYGYEPVGDRFTPEEAAHIKGVQANLWTEYIKTFPQAIYMELPRMAALSEVQWTNGEKDYEKFLQRLPALMAHYSANGYPYSKRAYDINGAVEVDTLNHTISYILTAPENAPIYYTTDGSEPSVASMRYERPVKIDKDTQIRAFAKYSFGASNIWKDSVSLHKAAAYPVRLLTSPAPKYARQPDILTNGRSGSSEWNTDEWIGYNGNDIIAEIDMVQSTDISEVSVNANVDTNSHVFDVRKRSVSVSDDNVNWQEVASQEYPALAGRTKTINTHTLTFPARKARYVKVNIEPEKDIPYWHNAKGKKGFVFIDEIKVR